MDLPFRRGGSGFPPRALGPVLTPPPVAPDYNTFKYITTGLRTFLEIKADVRKYMYYN